MISYERVLVILQLFIVGLVLEPLSWANRWKQRVGR